jgi:hypothetical protein
VDFSTVLAAVKQRGETAIGYLIYKYSHEADKVLGVKLNPAKLECITFSPEDRLIVLAELLDLSNKSPHPRGLPG